MTHILTHTENLQSHLAGALRSARWLYVFVLIPFHCFQQRKMRPFPCQRKLTHTDDAGGSDPHRDPTRGNERTEHMEQSVFDLILFAVKTPAKPYIPTAGGLFITW